MVKFTTSIFKQFKNTNKYVCMKTRSTESKYISIQFKLQQQDDPTVGVVQNLLYGEATGLQQ